MNQRSAKPSASEALPVIVNVARLSQIAAFPMREDPLSPVYSLTIVQREDERPEDTAYRVENFMTNLAFNVPKGHYLEITATKNLHVQGYFLACSPLIVTPSDTDELVIPLHKYAETPDLELPSKVLQFVVKKDVPSHCALVKSSYSSQSSREAPGFSTNNTFYQPPQPSSRRPDANLQRSASAFMPDFGESGRPAPSSSGRPSRHGSSSSHLF